MRKRRLGTWSVGHLASRTCGGSNTLGVDPVENGAEYSGGVEGIGRGGATGRPDGIGGAEGSCALGPIFWAEKGEEEI